MWSEANTKMANISNILPSIKYATGMYYIMNASSMMLPLHDVALMTTMLHSINTGFWGCAGFYSQWKPE